MNIAPSPLDHDQTMLLLRSSRLARVAFAIDDEPFVVTAAITVAPDGRMTLDVEDPDARAHLHGRHVAIEVDGQFTSTGARWSAIARGTAVACDGAAPTVGRHRGFVAAPWAALPVAARTFVVVPTMIVGHLLTREAPSDWFAGIPAS